MRREEEIAKKLTGYLDQSVANLTQGIAFRLQQARAEALARLADPQRASVREAVFAGPGGGTGGGRPFFTQVRFWAAVAAIAAAAVGYQQWAIYQQIQENEELDARILSSELPLDAYLDRGFQNWLKTTYSDR